MLRVRVRVKVRVRVGKVSGEGEGESEGWEGKVEGEGTVATLSPEKNTWFNRGTECEGLGLGLGVRG